MKKNSRTNDLGIETINSYLYIIQSLSHNDEDPLRYYKERIQENCLKRIAGILSIDIKDLEDIHEEG